MSKLIFVLLCCIAPNAFASSADSGRCPWKIPFFIIQNARSIRHSWSQMDSLGVGPKRDNGYQKGSWEMDLVFDPTYAGAQLSIVADTLRYSVENSVRGQRGNTFLTIAFVPGHDSINSLICEYTDPESDFNTTSEYFFTLKVFRLRFDDTSIVYNDSSLISVWDSTYQSQKITSYDFENSHSSSIAISDSLSGIFRPPHFADPAIVIQSPTQSDPLSITFLNSSLQCSFGASSDERSLEIFSALGIKAASCVVAPGGTEVVVPHIPPGFYFVRLGSAFAKVYVAE